ncbi:MAG: hypothetical protein ABIN73_08555 [candidate division WOR-3 bacterium]
MHNHKIKIRENLFYLLKEEEENYPFIEEKIREKEELLKREKLEGERMLIKFKEEMEKKKEELIKEGILKIEEECEKIYEEGKKKAKELIENIEKYKGEALKVFEDVIFKGEI